jgi:hypothetical protein
MGYNKNKKDRRIGLILASLIIVALSLLISGIPMTLAQETNYCCEKTTYGAWCQNEIRAACDPEFKASPTACDSTSYCKRGTCFDSQEGLCMENTPQKVCEDVGATWAEGLAGTIPQCSLGCCILGDQASLVTQTRCKAMTGLYGLETDFRADITDELTCIATANASAK